jgi:methyl-accepting chemotaxis protein
VLGAAFALGTSPARAQVRAVTTPTPSAAAGSAAAPTFTVDGQVALHALVSLSDAHLQKLADVLGMLAASDAVRSGEWARMRAPLAGVARVNVPATVWFALPNGSYWTVAQGHVAATLADRPYFPRVLKGQTVVGELVVSRATNRNSAIVAVPVRGRGDSVVGVLGASVHLDSLSALLRRELGGLNEGLVFFAVDAKPLGALNSDSALIFTEPMRLGDEGMRRAFTEMLAGQAGVVTYDFRGSRRTVLYRRSPITGWWYGFGATEPRAASRDR